MAAITKAITSWTRSMGLVFIDGQVIQPTHLLPAVMIIKPFVLTYLDGKIYEGEWHNGAQHGKGCVISPTGEPRQGIFENGRRLRWLDEDPVIAAAAAALQLQ